MSIIQVFEHSFLSVNQIFEQKHFVALAKLNALHNDKYFYLRHNGIKFKQYVGVIQVYDLTIEILPKIDNHDEDVKTWQSALIEMLRITKKLKIQKLGHAQVSRQNRHLLDIYFDWFLTEIELLIHQGLIKQYYTRTANVKTLKGKLDFANHITKNLVHKERFYTTHQVYEKDHLIHQILFKSLDTIEKCCKNSYLHSRCKTIKLNFPEVKNIAITEATFSKILKNRKTAAYQTPLAIAKFILLNFAPNVSNGSENMLSLLFDMNSLWEQYILARLKESDRQVSILGKQSTAFWEGINIKPDIIIDTQNGYFIIDTKWKDISHSQPSTHDLRQMYVYNDYWNATKSMLLYPSNETKFSGFKPFQKIISKNQEHHCSVGKISIFKKNEKALNTEIGNDIIDWFLNHAVIPHISSGEERI